MHLGLFISPAAARRKFSRLSFIVPSIKEYICKFIFPIFLTLLLPFANTLGMQFIGIGMEVLKDEESVHSFAKTLNRIGKACAEKGLMLTYHNHSFPHQHIDHPVGSP